LAIIFFKTAYFFYDGKEPKIKTVACPKKSAVQMNGDALGDELAILAKLRIN
jgi:hypothetical protein